MSTVVELTKAKNEKKIQAIKNLRQVVAAPQGQVHIDLTSAKDLADRLFVRRHDGVTSFDPASNPAPVTITVTDSVDWPRILSESFEYTVIEPRVDLEGLINTLSALGMDGLTVGELIFHLQWTKRITDNMS